MIEHNVLVAVADGSRAHFYRNSGSAQMPHLEIIGGFEQKNPPSHMQGRDAPGTSFASAGGVRSHISESDDHQKAEQNFAKSVLASLGDVVTSHRISNVILMAPPHMLGELRHNMPQSLRSLIVREIDKDFTKHSPQDIVTFLQTSR